MERDELNNENNSFRFLEPRAHWKIVAGAGW